MIHFLAKTNLIHLLLGMVAVLVLTGCEQPIVEPVPTGQNNPISTLTAGNFTQSIKTGKTLVLFAEADCPACEQLEVQMETAALSKEWPVDLSFAKLNKNGAEAIFQQNGVTETPTLMYFEGGNKKEMLPSSYAYAHELVNKLEILLED